MALMSKNGVALTVCIVLFAGTAGAQKARNSDTPVTSTFDDAGDIVLSTNLRIQSDGQGPYVHGSDGVRSILQTSNTCCQDWELSTGDSPNRAVWIDFRDALDPTTARPPFSASYVGARLIARCHVISPGSFPAMRQGETLNCPLLVTFPETRSTFWRIVFNPIAHAQTHFAQVSCVGADGDGKCNEWTVVTAVAQPDGAVKNVGRLEKVSFKGNTPPEAHGDFYFAFGIRVTRP